MKLTETEKDEYRRYHKIASGTLLMLCLVGMKSERTGKGGGKIEVKLWFSCLIVGEKIGKKKNGGSRVFHLGPPILITTKWSEKEKENMCEKWNYNILLEALKCC